jgi:hypothetical protein
MNVGAGLAPAHSIKNIRRKFISAFFFEIYAFFPNACPGLSGHALGRIIFVEPVSNIKC